jgi:uncharacterized surface protein with fasciclin (FAS1) repeats
MWRTPLATIAVLALCVVAPSGASAAVETSASPSCSTTMVADGKDRLLLREVRTCIASPRAYPRYVGWSARVSGTSSQVREGWAWRPLRGWIQVHVAAGTSVYLHPWGGQPDWRWAWTSRTGWVAMHVDTVELHWRERTGVSKRVVGDIVDTAVADGRFTTLVAAVQAAGLEQTLRGAGPLTVFAPTDAAFAALPSGTVETLLRAENRQQLVDILTYHVVAGAAARSTDLTDGQQLTTVNGAKLAVDLDDGVRIGNAKVIIADIHTTNGIIHVIDAVLLP